MVVRPRARRIPPRNGGHADSASESITRAEAGADGLRYEWNIYNNLTGLAGEVRTVIKLPSNDELEARQRWQEAGRHLERLRPWRLQVHRLRARGGAAA